MAVEMLGVRIERRTKKKILGLGRPGGRELYLLGVTPARPKELAG